MLTEDERQKAIYLLTRSRKALLEAVEGVTDEQARWKPAADRWSILGYVEHLAVSDDGLVEMVVRSLKTPPQSETAAERAQREQKLRETPIPRGANRAPGHLQPAGRFASLADAVAAFLEARARTLEYALTTQDDLRSHFTPHPVLGPMDGYQWLLANVRHVETHAGHIREIQSMDGFPKA